MKRASSVVFRIIYVRHGETSGNKEFRLQGTSDVPLNEDGEAQARKAGLSLRNVNFTRAYASDLCRARKTCELILENNERSVPQIVTELKIREKSFGEYEGIKWAEYAKIVQEAGKTPSTFNAPGAELNEDCKARMSKFFKELCQSVYDKQMSKNLTMSNENESNIDEKTHESECILVVSHGAVLRLLFLFFFKDLKCSLPEDLIYNVPPNTGISEFLVEYTPRKYMMECVRFHDAQHLESILQAKV